jgi:hypothetical protein
VRNYKKEREWQIKKYDQIIAKIDKNLGTKLRLKLKKENKPIARWVTENAEKYLKGEGD